MTRTFLAAVAMLIVTTSARLVAAQACCAGASSITPGRLALHEQAVVGLQGRASSMLGSYDARGAYTQRRSGSSEWDFEQDLLGALRVLERGQLAFLVPFLESRRSTPTTGAETGGGIGDINLGARYDFVLAHEHRYVPGVALLAGLTLPTGRPPESASPLGSDATGLGTVQGNFGVALEQSFDAWLVNVTGLLAKRATRTVQGVESSLAVQVTGLVAVGYVCSDDVQAALVVSYTREGDANVDGVLAVDTGKALWQVAPSVAWSIDDAWRTQGSAWINPPVDDAGRNEPATLGVSIVVIRSWL